jgi:Mg2+ and Co2+ transporter CorA
MVLLPFIGNNKIVEKLKKGIEDIINNKRTDNDKQTDNAYLVYGIINYIEDTTDKTVSEMENLLPAFEDFLEASNKIDRQQFEDNLITIKKIKEKISEYKDKISVKAYRIEGGKYKRKSKRKTLKKSYKKSPKKSKQRHTRK